MKKIKTTIAFLLFVSLFFVGFTSFQEDIWKAPEEAKKIENPIEKTTISINKGKKLFRSRCAVCHGVKGLGDGPGGKALVPKPKSLTTELVQNQTDGELFWKVSKGRNDMIKWEPILSETQRWHLINYMRTLK